MRLDHLLSKEYMLVFHAWRERTGVHSMSTTDDAIENSSFDKLRMTRGNPYRFEDSSKIEIQGSEAPLGFMVEDHGDYVL